MLSRRYGMFLWVCLTAGLSTVTLASGLRNYENDPDLAKAMRYDSEMNGGNRSIADQSQAEEHYLRYLAHAEDSGMRARVCVQLGVLFSTNWHAERGEKPDYEKARTYFEKALDEEPERVSRAMIRARLGMATPLQSPEERTRIRIEAYKWLETITELTETELEKLWIPVTPGHTLQEDRYMRAFQPLVKNVMLSEVENLVHEASLTANVVGSLNEIIESLPDSGPADRASQLIERWRAANVHRAMDESIEHLESIQPLTDEMATVETGNALGNIGQVAPGDHRGGMATRRRGHRNDLLLALGVGFAIIMILCILLYRKRIGVKSLSSE